MHQCQHARVLHQQSAEVCTDLLFKALWSGSEEVHHLQLRSDTDATREYEWIALDAAGDVASTDFSAVCATKLSEAQRGGA